MRFSYEIQLSQRACARLLPWYQFADATRVRRIWCVAQDGSCGLFVGNPVGNRLRQAQSPGAIRHEPQPRFASLRRNADHRRRLSANSQRNTGVFNDLPGSMQTISGHPLTGRKPDNSIPSLLLSDPAVLFSPPGFSFSSHNQLRDAAHRNQPRKPLPRTGYDKRSVNTTVLGCAPTIAAQYHRTHRAQPVRKEESQSASAPVTHPQAQP